MSNLNGPHLAVGYAGALLDVHFVHDSALDPVVGEFVHEYVAREARPTVRGVPDAAIDAFTEGVVLRFQNSYMGDTIDRLTSNTPGRAVQFIVPVVNANLAAGGDVRGAATICALWAFYTERFVAGGRARSDAGGDELTLELDEHVANAAVNDHVAFLRYKKVFGDLAEESAFSKPFAEALRALRGDADVQSVLKNAWGGEEA